MKLSQLTESFVISNDEFEDYLNRTTEQLAQELQAGKNARDAIHDLALQFSAQHNKAYEAYVRMSDALTARMHTLELDAPSTDIVPADTMNEPMADMGDEMGAPEMGAEPEMMTDPMGDMEMDTPADSEMPSDSDMDDYAAVMDNEPEAEEMGESVVNEASCGCCGNDPCDCDDSCDCKKVTESENRPYICVHAKKGKHECHAATSYEAAKKAAAHWKLKSTAGIDAHLAVEESAPKMKGDSIKAQREKDKEHADAMGRHVKSGRKKTYTSTQRSLAKMRGEELPEGAVSESMEVINQIVADKQAGKLHGMTVDMFTASAIKQIYDAVGDDNKAKLDNLMTSKEGVLKAANIAMKMMKEGKMNEFAPLAGIAARAVGGAIAKRAGATGAANMIGKAAGALDTASGIANKVGKAGIAAKGIGGMAKAAGNFVKNRFDKTAESKADSIMRTSTRASFSEYNEFYKELDKAAKAGKKAGDTITVGGKNIKLKSNPKQMHQLTDSDMNAIDALAEKCKSHKK